MVPNGLKWATKINHKFNRMAFVIRFNLVRIWGKIVQILTEKSSKWVRHNQASWSSFNNPWLGRPAGCTIKCSAEIMVTIKKKHSGLNVIFFFFFLPARSAALPAAAVKKKNPTCTFGDGGKEKKVLMLLSASVGRFFVCSHKRDFLVR